MKTLVTTAALLMFASTATEAKVLIYKSTVRTVSDTESAFPRSIQNFFVIDPDQSLIGSVEALVADGKKLILLSQPAIFRFSEAPLPFGKTAMTFSLSSTTGGSNDFYSNVMIHGRGPNVSLLSSSAAVGNITTFPRIFHGIALQDSAFNSKGSFVERRFVLSYQPGPSIAANDGNQTAEQVINAIVEQLKLLGFVLP
jgi:hypothetical protein